MPKAAKSSAQGMTNCLNPKKMFQAVKKSYQTQSKNLTQKSHFINLDHPNQFQACPFHTLKIPKWTGQ